MGTLTYSVGDPTRADHRLRELMLYIAQKTKGAERFGATKLNKALWRADFEAYLRFGEPVTGVAYQKLENGPAPYRLLPSRDTLIQAKAAEIQQVPAGGGRYEDRLVSKRRPQVGLFAEEELSLVDEIISDMWNVTGRDASTASHGIAWEITKMHECIPYQAAFLSDDPLTQDDREWAEALIAKHGWE